MNKRNNIIQFLISISILIVIAFISSLLYTKFDLTQEKRHSLTDSSIELMDSLNDQIYIRVYLHGDFPAQFKKLEKSIEEVLDELVDYSDGLVSYDFIDPYDGIEGEEEYRKITDNLFESGLDFTRINYKENGVAKYSNIWPGAVVNYQGDFKAIQFFKSSNSSATAEMINSSVNNIEFELSSCIRSMFRKEKPKVAILEGHDELMEVEMVDLLLSIKEYYSVNFVEINGRVDALSSKLDGAKQRINNYDALIVAKPMKEIEFQDKVVLDQFLMNGGKILWMVDPLIADIDSLRGAQSGMTSMAVTNEIGIYDMLFSYGVRLNRDLILDYNCSKIPLDVGPNGNQRQMKLFNWYYNPTLLAQDINHPIVTNLDPIRTKFASSIDLVGNNANVKKEVILKSSKLSKIYKAPVRVTMSVVDFDLSYFENNPQPNKNIGVLLEGTFNSSFTNIVPDTMKKDPFFAYRQKSLPTKMIVIADGDIGRNPVRKVEGGYEPISEIGFDIVSRQVIYDNKEFLINCLNYLMDDKALISVRSRSIELRKLDAGKVQNNKTILQIINVVSPLFIIGLFGVFFYITKKKRNT